MKPDDCLEVGACARQLERHRAGKAIADCRDSTRVNLLLGQEHIETCSSQGTSEVRVRHQGGEAGDSLVSERGLALALALALVVKREGQVAQAGQSDGAALDMLVEAQPFVAQQHSGPESRSVVVHGQLPDHPPATNLIVDGLDAHTSERSNSADFLGAVSGPRNEPTHLSRRWGCATSALKLTPGSGLRGTLPGERPVQPPRRLPPNPRYGREDFVVFAGALAGLAGGDSPRSERRCSVRGPACRVANLKRSKRGFT